MVSLTRNCTVLSLRHSGRGVTTTSMLLTIRRTKENKAIVSQLFSDYIAAVISAVQVTGSFKVRAVSTA